MLGRELAVWRADDGNVNVWENRCLHRGVRLSIGINDGRELKCQYHGWRYANRTAGCTYIPAHPADAPARTITNRTYPAVERYGLVWSTRRADERAGISGIRRGELLALRGCRSMHRPTRASTCGDRFQPMALDGDGATVTSRQRSLSVALALRSAPMRRRRVFVQPVDSGRSVIRGVLDRGQRRDRIAILRHHNERLTALRDASSATRRRCRAPAPIEPVYRAGVARNWPRCPTLRRRAQGGPARQVARKWPAADDIAGFELGPLRGHLPTFQPGAHIDVHLPNGLIRQYSITNGAGRERQLRHRRQARARFQGRLGVPARHRARGRRARHLRAAQQLPAAPRRA